MKPLAEAYELVTAGLADAERACGTYADDPANWHARHRHEMDVLARRLKTEVGASINDRWDGANVRISGIRSTSTSGLAGALKNWLRAADARLG